MPKKAKIITNFSEFLEAELADAAALIYYSLKKNASFFTGIPRSIQELKSLLRKYNKIRTSPFYTSRTPEIKKARIAIEALLRENGNWINFKELGNLSLLMKSGFPLHQVFKNIGILPQTVLTFTREKRTAKIIFSISKIKIQHVYYGLMFIEADHSEQDLSKWFFYYCGAKRKGILPERFESGKEYKVVSFGMGTDKRLRYSNVVLIKIP